jgi:hypothetical protein
MPKKLLEFISRRIKFVPMFFAGAFGTLPLGKPMMIVLGTPIPTTRNPNPTDEECRKYNTLFIEGLEKLFYEHREAVGHPTLELHVL